MTKTKKVSPDLSTDKTKQLEEKINILEDRLKRSLADYSNLEKRIESQRQLFITLATTSVIIKMVEALDDFNLTYSHLHDAGLKIAIDKFTSALRSEGVEEINPLNQDFDPQTMECVETISGQNNKVIIVRKLGYKLNSQVIRPAQVVVGKSDLN
jgi:molecular chaperone GrpE